MVAIRKMMKKQIIEKTTMIPYGIRQRNVDIWISIHTLTNNYLIANLLKATCMYSNSLTGRRDSCSTVTTDSVTCTAGIYDERFQLWRWFTPPTTPSPETFMPLWRMPSPSSWKNAAQLCSTRLRASLSGIPPLMPFDDC